VTSSTNGQIRSGGAAIRRERLNVITGPLYAEPASIEGAIAGSP
jgi:hypothetical protein